MTKESDVDEVRRTIEKLVLQAFSYCSTAYVVDNVLNLEGGLAGEYLEKLAPYNTGAAGVIAKRLFPGCEFKPIEPLLRKEFAERIKQLESLRARAQQEGIDLEGNQGIGPVRAGRLLQDYIKQINSGELPQLISQHEALSGIEIGPGLICIIGAPPGAGKTALASQVMFDGCELDESLRAYILNAEMGFDSLIRRQLTKLTRIKSDSIRFGCIDDDQREQIERASRTLASRLERVSVYPDPDLSSLTHLLNQPPGLVVVDYLQKFAPPDKDARAGVNVVVGVLRKLANHGHAVLALSATKRDPKGKHDSKELGLSSFKESGEVEFNADSAYVLRDTGPVDEAKPYVRQVTLAHVKNRHGAKVDRDLEFHMPRMEFTFAERFIEFDSFSCDDDNPFAEAS